MADLRAEDLTTAALRVSTVRERDRAVAPDLRLARAIAVGLDLDFDFDLEPDSRAELRMLAQELLLRFGGALQ